MVYPKNWYNGPQFRATTFQIFMKQNGIKHILVPAYHPASNGAAERSVRIVKEVLRKQVLSGGSKYNMKQRLANFLLKYRTTPQSTTGFTPAELLMKRRLRTRLSLIMPDLSQKVENKQAKQKRHFQGNRKQHVFHVGDRVRVLTPPHRAGKWELGTVVAVCGTRRYLVDINNRVRSVHVNHMLMAHDEPDGLHDSCDTTNSDDYFDFVSVPELDQTKQSDGTTNGSKGQSPTKSLSPRANGTSRTTPNLAPKLRSQRLRKPVIKLSY